MLVSPLYRALQTAYLTFKDHPDFENIKFVVVPSMRESINISSDLTKNIEDTFKEYSEKFPNFDTSEFDKIEDKMNFFLYDLPEDLREEMQSKIEPDESDPTGTNIFKLAVDIMERYHPGPVEPKWNIFDRCAKIKKFVKNYIKENQVPKDKKVFLVAHFVFFYMYTGEWDGELSRDKPLWQPPRAAFLKNCEIVSDPTDYDQVE